MDRAGIAWLGVGFDRAATMQCEKCYTELVFEWLGIFNLLPKTLKILVLGGN